MDTEKLIEQLNDFNENHIAVLCGSGQCACGYLCYKDDCIVVQAATALSTLQAENKRLNKIVCSIPTTPDSGRTVSQDDKEMSMCAYLDDLEAENEKLRTELEQVKWERDAAIDCCSGYCATCRFVKDCAKHDMNDAAPIRWYYGDCEDWEWRGQKED